MSAPESQFSVGSGKEADIWIIYASAGAGHRKAAEAIHHELTRQGRSARMMDVVEYMPRFLGILYAQGYLFLIRHLSWVWGFAYWLSDSTALSLLNGHLRKYLDVFLCRRLLVELDTCQPKVVISTHFLATSVVSFVKEKKSRPIRLINVITDFGVHRFWLSSQADVNCCATEVTAGLLKSMGIAGQKIHVTGIPVHEKFLRPLTEDQQNSAASRTDKEFTVLLMTGGIGAGPMEEIVDLLSGDARVLVVCGSNRTLYEKLARKKNPTVSVFGFVDDIQRLVREAHVVVTKAGGLTVSECLSVGVPMIFFFLLPGQEMINARTISDKGAGIMARSLEDIKRQVIRLRDNPDDWLLYKKQCQALARPDACERIAALI